MTDPHLPQVAGLFVAWIFIGGWGNVQKKHVETLGMHECPNCRRATQWDVYDIEKRATVYFVPVWKYSSQRVVLCSGCGAGAEMSTAEIAQLRPPRPNPLEAFFADPCQSRPPRRAEVRQFNLPPNLVASAWLDELSAYLAGEGYVERQRHWTDESQGRQLIVAGEFGEQATQLQIYLFIDSLAANRFVQSSGSNGGVADAMRLGRFKIAGTDRRAFSAFDSHGLPAGRFGRWTQAAAHVAPPDDVR